jgi:aryl-alcohol dehydrogenase
MQTATVAVAVAKDQDFEFRHVEIDSPKNNEVLIRTLASGICHTDMLLRDGLMGVSLPAVPGHEGAGIIVAVGPVVKTLKVGDYVGLSQNYCGYCSNCLSAHPMSCKNYTQYNLQGLRPDGSNTYSDRSIAGNFIGQSSFGTYMLGSERNAVPLPADLAPELAAPLGCGFVTGAGAVLNVMKPSPGSSIAVYGAGAVGMAVVAAAKISGCTTIIAVDLHDSRLDLALEMGATHCFRGDDEELASKIRSLTDRGEGTDFAIDAVGVPKLLATAVEATCRGGFTAALGQNGFGHKIPILLETLTWNRRVQGIILGDQIPQIFMPQLIQFHRDGRFPYDKLIRSYPFEDLNEACKDAESGQVTKPVIKFES